MSTPPSSSPIPSSNKPRTLFPSSEPYPRYKRKRFHREVATMRYRAQYDEKLPARIEGHHRDYRKRNCSPANIVLMRRSEHRRLHYPDIAWRKKIRCLFRDDHTIIKTPQQRAIMNLLVAGILLARHDAHWAAMPTIEELEMREEEPIDAIGQYLEAVALFALAHFNDGKEVTV